MGDECAYVSFGGQTCAIAYQNALAGEMVTFLFADMLELQSENPQSCARYSIRHENHRWLVSLDNGSNHQYEDINSLGNFLAGDVLFRLIEKNPNHLAIHAGLVSSKNGSLLLPAESGSGKTSVTAWLVSAGWRYHTDELVLIDPLGDENHAFSRPLNIKSKGLEPIQELLKPRELTDTPSAVRQSNGITMLHQSVFNRRTNEPEQEQTQEDRRIPAITSIVFPHYSSSETPRLTRLSSAAAGLELMRSNVIARNLAGHGFNDIVKLVKNTPAFQLYYQHFDDLPQLFEALTDE